MKRIPLMALCLSFTLAACASTPPTASPAPPPETPRQQDPRVQQYDASFLRPGDCIEPLPENFLVTVVPCGMPHSAEYAASYVLPDGPYPGADLARLMENGCFPRMRIKESKKADIGLYALWPAPDDWPRYRTGYCLAVPLDGKKTTGRVVK